MRRLYRIVVLMAIWMPHQAWAQTTDCPDAEQTIALATAEFEAGHFYSVSGILSPCLGKFNRDQRQRAHLLLTQTYLLLDDPIGAQRSYLEVLSANPEFIPDEQLHSIDVVYLSKRFTATPKVSWFVGGGSNVSPVRLILDLDAAEDNGEKYTLRAGYHFGGGGEYSYNDNIKVRLGVNYLHTTYRSEAVGTFKLGIDSLYGDTKTFIDRQTWVNVPLTIHYSDNTGIYRPYVYAGFSVSKLFSDRASITVENAGPDRNATEGEEATFSTLTVESPTFDFTDRRNDFNQSLMFGAGVKYKVGLDFVFAEIRYSAGLKNIVNPDKRLGNYAYDRVSDQWRASLEPIAHYRHTDDLLRLDNIMITVGFLRPIYKPRELKRARTKGVLRKMNKAQ